MIKKLEAKEIVQILDFSDPIEQIFPCDRGEWVQFLMQNFEHPEIFVIGRVDKDLLTAYAVVANMVGKPLSNAVSILFASEYAVGDEKIKESIISWAKEKGAQKVIFQASDRADLEKMKVDKISYVGHWIV